MENKKQPLVFEFNGNKISKQPAKLNYIIKCTGYAYEARLNQQEDKSIYWHTNEIVATNENATVNVGDFVQFEMTARYLDTNLYNEESILSMVNKVKGKEPYMFISNANYAGKDSAVSAIIESNKTKSNSKIIIGNNIVKVVEYYYIKEHQITSIVSEEPFVEGYMRLLLDMKYEQKGRASIMQS